MIGMAMNTHSFVEEHGPRHRERFLYRVLGKEERNESNSKHDYDHTGMLIHRDAEGDHFPAVLDWVRRHDGGSGRGTDVGM